MRLNRTDKMDLRWRLTRAPSLKARRAPRGRQMVPAPADHRRTRQVKLLPQPDAQRLGYCLRARDLGRLQQPWAASTCNIDYDIELQTFGEHLSVELRIGSPGSSRIVKTKSSQGGRVSFSSLCAGGYFVAIGNDDYVSVTPVRQFASDRSYSSQITLQRGSGNVSRQSRKTL